MMILCHRVVAPLFEGCAVEGVPLIRSPIDAAWAERAGLIRHFEIGGLPRNRVTKPHS